ncbi:SHOCT domain-containing protein [Jonesia quinghaiensis]|uniref:SHOCT domain-containing protein n=1 Tax=Jonesia quinghaiensis TaxID=262806 RepID=UPI0004232F94|nr:SHOCT domain-containing protein [Jonesia quinghaiensis]
MSDQKEPPDKLSALIALYQSGAITLEEFKREKEKLQAGEATPTSPKPTEGEKPSGMWKWVVWPIAVIGAMAFFGSLGDDDSADDEVSDWEVTSMCEQWVDKKLKAPSTAKYSDQVVKSAGILKWEVTGAVDSENSFGAMIRNEWTCSIYLDGDTFRGTVSAQ